MEFSTMAEWILRMLLACVCGIAIGIERNTRAKEAGIRTHSIVACASALMMIVSKYGFFDLMEVGNEYASDIRLDPSRMAQGIVTGVGFLGAGMIYFQRGLVKGLTTAAGVWAVSGIGMAIGAGLYAVGIVATIIVLALQIVLHNKSIFSTKYRVKTVKVKDVSEDDFQKSATYCFEAHGVTVIDVSVSKNKEGLFDYSFFVEVPKTVSEERLVKIFEYRSSVDLAQ